MLHVELFGFAIQGDLRFGVDWYKAHSLYSRIHLEHMLNLMFSQLQIKTTVEQHFGVGLEF